MDELKIVAFAVACALPLAAAVGFAILAVGRAALRQALADIKRSED